MSSRGPLLSAAMIVRDEAAHLDQCLATLDGVVDEIVVVDTGSADDSVAVARAHGARVFHVGWEDDFSRARNAALDQVHGRWVLYVDADERLAPVQRSDVVATLDAAEEVALRVWLRPFVGATACREYRVWRNDARIRFEGIIHEKVVPSIRLVAEADGRRVGCCDLLIEHLGYEHDQTAKHLRNVPLLRAQLVIEPRNVFNWRNLAAALAALGHLDEAEGALERAVELVRATDPPPAGGALAYADLIHRRDADDRAGDLVDEGLRRYPDDPVLLWTKAFVELREGAPSSALVYLDRLAAIDRATLDDTIAYDERLFSVFGHSARALALFRTGRFADASTAWGAAEHADPANPEHRVKRMMAEQLAHDQEARCR